MYFDLITIFPNIFDSYFSESLLEKAQDRELININIHDLRNYSNDERGDIDGKPYGGGRGMVMKVAPIWRAIQDVKREDCQTTIIFFTPRGEKYNQKKVEEFSDQEQLILICGRYEGVDERVRKHIADRSISIGDYVLMGGELPAMIIVESVSRLIPDVVGIDNEGFLEERQREKGMIAYPQYTRPEVFEPEEGKEWRTPKVLLSGHHKKIQEWREGKGEIIH